MELELDYVGNVVSERKKNKYSTGYKFEQLQNSVEVLTQPKENS